MTVLRRGPERRPPQIPILGRDILFAGMNEFSKNILL